MSVIKNRGLSINIIKTLLVSVFCLFSQLLFADFAGDWIFNVDLRSMGGDEARITMSADEENILSGTYAGHFGDASLAGTIVDNTFQFTIESVMGPMIFKGSLLEDGTLEGPVVAHGEEMGMFKGRRPE